MRIARQFIAGDRRAFPSVPEEIAEKVRNERFHLQNNGVGFFRQQYIVGENGQNRLFQRSPEGRLKPLILLTLSRPSGTRGMGTSLPSDESLGYSRGVPPGQNSELHFIESYGNGAVQNVYHVPIEREISQCLENQSELFLRLFFQLRRFVAL